MSFKKVFNKIAKEVNAFLDSFKATQTGLSLIDYYKQRIDLGLDINDEPLPAPKAGNKPFFRSGRLRNSYRLSILDGGKTIQVRNIAPYSDKLLDRAPYFGISKSVLDIVGDGYEAK